MNFFIRLFSFKGKVNRRYFAIVYSLLFIVSLIATIFFTHEISVVQDRISAEFSFVRSGITTAQTFRNKFFLLQAQLQELQIKFLIFLIVSQLLCLPTAIKRLHDLNKSGYWSSILFVPILKWIFVLYLLFAKGKTDSAEDPVT